MVSDSISLVVRRIGEIGYRPLTLFCAVVDSRSVAGALVSSYRERSPDSVCRGESVRECQRHRLPAQLKIYSSSAEEAARAATKLNGLPQKGRRASNNRSLLSSLQQDGVTSGVTRE